MASKKKHTPAGVGSPAGWDEFKARVRAASQLEDVVAADADVNKDGKELVCCSPLRGDDDTPSFAINVEKQLWIDRGTGQGGDVFAYVMAKHGIGFGDAVRFLAARAGIPSPGSSPKTDEDARLDAERHLVESILTEAATIYHAALDSGRRGFLHTHYGFTDTLIDDEKLGYDPGGTYLWEELKKKGHSDEDLFRSGLFVEGTTHVGVSRFHDRLTMPYWRRGSVVYLCARATKETPKIPKRRDGKIIKDQEGNDVLLDPPKYLKLKTNDDADDLSEGQVRSSISKTISNEWFAGEDSCDRAVDLLLIAEGMPDYLSLLQAGCAVLSPVTIRFRKQDHEKLLRLCRRAKKIGIVPDQEANGAGMLGAAETATVLSKAGMDVRIVVLPHEALKAAAQAEVDKLKARTDPPATPAELKKAADWKIDANEFLRDHPDGVEFGKLVAQASPFIDFLVEQIPSTLRGTDLDVALKSVLELIARLESAIETEHYLDKLKARFQVGKGALRDALRDVTASADEEADDGDNADTKVSAVFEMLAEIKLVRSATGRVFSIFGPEAVPTDSPVFTRKIAKTFHDQTNKLVSASTIETALLPLLGAEIPSGQVPIRYAHDKEGAIVVDLGDRSRKVVRITAAGCELLDESPVPFFRPDGMRPLPKPFFPSGDSECASVLDEFRLLLGFKKEDFASALVWAICGMRPMEPQQAEDEDELNEYAVLKVVGSEGSGKTGAARLIRRAIDPRVPDVVSLPVDNLKDLAISAENARALVFDNISFVPGMMSDGLCRVSTADGMEVRELYTARDQTVFRGSNPVILTSITDVVSEADLLSRCLSIRLPVRETRTTKKALAKKFRELHPRLIGALCYCVSRALKDLDQTLVPDTVRMQDAAQFALAAAPAAGFTAEQIAAAFTSAADDAEATVKDDPVALALVEVVTTDSPWVGQTQGLLDELTKEASAPDPVTGKPRKKLSKHWPDSPRGLTAKLRKLEPTLKRLGFIIEFPTGRGGKDGKDRVLKVTRQVSSDAKVEDVGLDDDSELDDKPEPVSVDPKCNGRNRSTEESEPKGASPVDPSIPSISGDPSTAFVAGPSPSPPSCSRSSSRSLFEKTTDGTDGRTETAGILPDAFRRSLPSIDGTDGPQSSADAPVLALPQWIGPIETDQGVTSVLCYRTWESNQVHEHFLDLGSPDVAASTARALGWSGDYDDHGRAHHFTANVIIRANQQLEVSQLKNEERLSATEFAALFALKWKNWKADEIVEHEIKTYQ